MSRLVMKSAAQEQQEQRIETRTTVERAAGFTPVATAVAVLAVLGAADFLKEYLKTHHPGIYRRVIATESANLSAVTEPEIEALAKRHMIAAV